MLYPQLFVRPKVEVLRLYEVALRARILLHDFPNFGYRNRSVTAATIYLQRKVDLGSSQGAFFVNNFSFDPHMLLQKTSKHFPSRGQVITVERRSKTVKTLTNPIPRHRYIPWTPMTLPNLLLPRLEHISKKRCFPRWWLAMVVETRSSQQLGTRSSLRVSKHTSKKNVPFSGISQLDFEFLKPNTKIWTWPGLGPACCGTTW